MYRVFWAKIETKPQKKIHKRLKQSLSPFFSLFYLFIYYYYYYLDKEKPKKTYLLFFLEKTNYYYLFYYLFSQKKLGVNNHNTHVNN